MWVIVWIGVAEQAALCGWDAGANGVNLWTLAAMARISGVVWLGLLIFPSMCSKHHSINGLDDND